MSGTGSPELPAATAYMAELEKSLSALAAKAEGLRTDLKAAEKSRRAATRVNWALFALVVLFVGMLVAVVWQGGETNRRIADCTTPGGTCYEQGRARTANAIQDIVRVSIYMAQCARLYPGEAGPEYDRKLEKCVYERLAAPAPAPSTGG